MAKVDPRDFLLNTDYELDKIILYKTGSLNNGDYDVSVPHGLPFTPLIFGVCAFSEDFSDPKTIPYFYQTTNDFTQFNALAFSSDIKLSFSSTDASLTKIYYRIYAFEPTESAAKVASTSKFAEQFILNTDYNYCKLFKRGVTTGGDATIAHNLGYIPQVLAWEERSGLIYPINESAPEDPQMNMPEYISVSDTSVTIKSSADKVHYRIYYDEA